MSWKAVFKDQWHPKKMPDFSEKTAIKLQFLTLSNSINKIIAKKSVKSNSKVSF